MHPKARKSSNPVTLGAVEEALGALGLTPRGAFHPAKEDAVPPFAEGRPTGTLILAGHAGREMWRAFQATAPSGEDPLDGWSRRVLSALAAELGARPFFPSEGPPYLPFQRWALKAEPVHVSPIGILIHPDYGLWHGYRGALAFAERLALPAREPRPSPCESCAEKPCLSTCPVNALREDGYDIRACIAHITEPRGADCLELGCRARRACPIGREYVYEAAQAGFHMAAFVKAYRPGSES